jgi:hypothetical protein
VENIPKHNAKQEGKGYYREEAGVRLLVGWDTVGVNDFLKCVKKFVCLKVAGRFQSCILYGVNLAFD